jgi:hypothetical protein
MVVVLGIVSVKLIFMEKYPRLHFWKDKIWNSNAEAFLDIK